MSLPLRDVQSFLLRSVPPANVAEASDPDIPVGNEKNFGEGSGMGGSQAISGMMKKLAPNESSHSSLHGWRVVSLELLKKKTNVSCSFGTQRTLDDIWSNAKDVLTTLARYVSQSKTKRGHISLRETLSGSRNSKSVPQSSPWISVSWHPNAYP